MRRRRQLTRGALAFDARNEFVERGPELVAQFVALDQDFMFGAIDHDQPAPSASG